jgi:hypothetical protein
MKRKIISIERISLRNKIIRKIGLDTDNSFSWMEHEKLTWNYKPAIVKKGNILHANYIIFSELIGLLSRENPDKEINKKKVITFLKKNRIKPIRKKEVDQGKVNEVLEKLKKERDKNSWSAGDNDLRIISVYSVTGMDCISTNNLKDFREPCRFLNIDLDLPSIIEPGSMQDINRMWRNLYGKRNY